MRINTNNMIFVFGSNLAGRHGAGAAQYAKNYRGARYGVGVGRTGSCYALPTKDSRLQTLPTHQIAMFVHDFLEHALVNDQKQFQVTCIGCGLAGLKHEDIAAMFTAHPSNCWFDEQWKPYLPEGTKFWGTF